jgi:hypothetical protein
LPASSSWQRPEVVQPRVVERAVALHEVEHHAVGELEARLERFGRLADEALEGLLAPLHLTLLRAPRRALGRAARLTLLGLLALDDVLGRLRHHEAAVVEALAPGAAGDLLEVAHREQVHLLAVVLRQLIEQDGADGDVDADAEGVGAGDHLEQPLLRQLLDEQAVLGQQARVVDADAEAQQPAHILAVRGVETEVADGGAQPFALLPAGELHAGEALPQLGALALGEVDDVGGDAVAVDELLHRLVQRRLAVVELQRHRPLLARHPRHLAAAAPRQVLLDRRRVAERRRHQQELARRQHQQRHLPGDAAVGVGVVVELVHDHVRRVDARHAQRHVRQHLGGAADDRGVRVDAGVAGEHPHPLGAEGVAQREELLRGEGLDRAGVEGAPPLRRRLELQAEGDERLARAGGSGEHHVLARPQLEQRLLLRRVELEGLRLDVGEEAVEELVRRGSRPGVGEELRQRCALDAGCGEGRLGGGRGHGGERHGSQCRAQRQGTIASPTRFAEAARSPRAEVTQHGRLRLPPSGPRRTRAGSSLAE